ncbi:hypothetical protein BV898_12158 [Hypsibius exemplaris]|uniref:Protein kinase domain-containing protein n=1 Tax=Hypsibius exemplaris TaxID=2072580 RepID=A0A1W0WEH4_HYPEX|nr:hypothetical protein BV898_12158 [Hypsibius exemplaris]
MGPYGLFQYSKYWRNVELLALVLWADPNVLSSPEAADKNNTVRTALDKEFGKGLASSKSFSVYSVVRNMGSFGGSYVFAVGIPKQSATTTFGLNLATNEHLKYPICITGADGMFLVWPEISNASLISDSLVSVSPGGGRRSTVYKGRLKGNFSVAVKDIPILAGSDKIQHNKEIMEKIYEKFEKLRHPNIARHIYSHLYIPPPDEFGFPVYRVVMTFCGGGTLANRVKDIIKPKQLIDWSNGILSGLQYLHEANIIHRDLKGEHIMFQGPGQGYGLVQIISLGRTPTASSQSYVSPALSRTAFQPQDAEVFTSYDIWSWACVVIQMVTGVAPKAASLVGESKSKYVEGTPTVLVDLPDGLVQLVRECLEMDPKLRPSSSDLLNSCSSKDIEQRCGSWICPSRKRVEPSSIRAGMSQQV